MPTPQLLRGSNIKRGETDWSEDLTKYWQKITPDIQKYTLEEGDIVVAMDGSLVGRSFARLSKKDIPALLLQRVARIRSSKIDMGYLKEYVYSDYFTKHCDSVKTVTAIPHISPKDIRKFTIPLPPTKTEQSSIAQVLSDIDELIEKLDKLITKKKNIKQGAMQELLIRKRRLPEFREPWKKEKLGKYLKFQVGFPFSSIHFNQKEEGIRLIKNRDLKSDDQIFYYNGNYLNEYLVKDGDVLVGMDGEFIPCIWKKGIALLNQRVGRLISLKKISLPFAYYYLQKPLKEIESRTSSTTVKHLSHDDVENLELPLPSFYEQEAIAQVLYDMDVEIEELEKKRDKYIIIKKGMMQKLLTGEIRLQ